MINLIFLQDTLTAAYAEKWSEPVSAGAAEQFFTSAELLPVVFGVTLIIWSVLLVNLYRIEKRLTKLEKNSNASNE